MAHHFPWMIPTLARRVVLVAFSSTLALGQLPVVRIGIVLDGPSERNEALRQVLEREIQTILEENFRVQFPASQRIEADWTAAGVKEAVDRLFADSEVDVVLALGVLTSNDVALRSQLPKPAFAPFVINPELQGIPLKILERPLSRPGEVERVRVSGVANLSYITAGVDVAREVARLREITPFSRLAVLELGAWQQDGIGLVADLRGAFQSLNLEEVHVVPVGALAEEAVKAIPSTVQAVYVSPLPSLSSAEFDRLVQLLIERRLPSFSYLGRSEVERGLMASLGAHDDILPRARRVAINIQKVLLGESAGDIEVEYQREERLTVNLATARAIGVSPPYTVLIEADLLNEDLPQVARTLSLSQVVQEASAVNLDLAVADRRVAASLELVRESRSPLLPQADISGNATFIDAARAEITPLVGQRNYAASLSADQLIYSDRVWADYDIQKRVQELREEEQAELRLDVILEAAESYLNVLRAKTIEQVQKENLQLTRSNLQLARSRVEIGVAGREEEFRWESQIATNQKDVIDAESLSRRAEIAVNRVLNRELDEKFSTLEVTLDDPELVSSFEDIRPYIESPGSFSVFSAWMVGEALRASPELRQRDAIIAAQERELTASERDFYLPDVTFRGALTGMDVAVR